MISFFRLKSFVTRLFFRRELERELDQELQSYVEFSASDKMNEGISPEEARRLSRLELGGIDQTKERVRASLFGAVVVEFCRDAKYALRAMGRNRGFTGLVLISLALGIGANTVVFGVVNALLLRPLPIEEPEQLYSVEDRGEPNLSFLNYKDIRDRNVVFSSLFMTRIVQVAVGDVDGARRVWGYLVTGNYFETLGINPAMGRFFGPKEDIEINANPYAVLSYEIWTNRFGGDPQIIGQTVRINTHPYTVLGVAPEGFHGTETFYWPDVWLPLTMQSQIEGSSWLDRRGTRNGWSAGRLKPGVTRGQANENLKAIGDTLAQEHTTNEGIRLTLSVPGLASSQLRNPVSAFAVGLTILAALVLLAACINIASLLSARLTDRSRELFVRLSIGASRGRILRQLLTESVLLSVLGGLIGFVLAKVALGLLSQWRAPLELPVRFEVNADFRVFLFAFSVALVTSIIFGTVPAQRVWRSERLLVPFRRWAARDVLLVVQVSLCCLLITASFVAIRGLFRSFDVPLGFRPEGVSVISYDLGQAGYSAEDGPRFQQRVMERIAQIPGVEDVSFAKSVPLSTDQSRSRVYPPSTTDFRPGNSVPVTYYLVSPAYFRTAGTNLIAGREFTAEEADGSAPVAIVNETFARRVLGIGPWIGRRYAVGSNSTVEVIGVVEDGKYSYLSEPPTPVLFEPILRRYSSEVTLLARSSRPPQEVAAEMSRIVASLDPGIPVFGAGALTQLLGLPLLPARTAVIALGAFGVLALMLALTGIHGVATYTVVGRRREIGIRIAVGANPSNVIRLVFGRTVALVMIGSLAGLLLGLAATKILASVVVGVSPRDPVVLGGAILTMSVVGIAAVWFPLRRALKIDPVEVLRQN